MNSEALASLHAEAFGSGTSGRAWTAHAFEGLLGDPLVFLCVQDDAAGFALGRAVAGEAELLTLAVCVAEQRKGIGRALLMSFEVEAKRRDADMAFLEVGADNTPACALYRTAGYVEQGRRRAYYTSPLGQKSDAVIMSKGLRSVTPSE